MPLADRIAVVTGASRGIGRAAALALAAAGAHVIALARTQGALEELDDAIREAGAKEVHFRIASPPITHPDFYGIDTPEREKLLAATHDLGGMRAYIGADSLAFLSIAGLYRAMGEERRNPAQPQFTDHCFTGDYPTPLTDLAVATPRRLSILAEAD